MPSNSPDSASRKPIYIIASLCILIALVQLAAMTVILNRDGFLSSTDSDMLSRVVFPLAFAILVNLAAGVAVYLARVEALACMGYLLAQQLGATIEGRASVLDLLLRLALVYFTARLFKQWPVQQGWRRPLPMLLLGLTASQLANFVYQFPVYPMLISNGSVSPLSALGVLLGCGAFYAAFVMTQSHTVRAKKFFLFAAIAMGLSISGWSFKYSFTTPFLLGILIALFGFGLTRRQQVQ